ncbi:Hypothetical protein LDBND_1577 [Lactobacillus delbrueckii subsp. bulgaricus ND02]|nr:Hypothetical protein LDBND_1577 [Lactobacillus delbrueckii subsp. bulgaricus ND02]
MFLNMFDSFIADSFTKSFLKLAEKERLKKEQETERKKKSPPRNCFLEDDC